MNEYEEHDCEENPSELNYIFNFVKIPDFFIIKIGSRLIFELMQYFTKRKVKIIVQYYLDCKN
jgi:hypothetical protein